MRKLDVYAFIAQQRQAVESGDVEPLTGEADLSHFRRFSADLPTQKLATESEAESQELNRVFWQIDGEQLSSEMYPQGRFLLHTTLTHNHRFSLNIKMKQKASLRIHLAG